MNLNIDCVKDLLMDIQSFCKSNVHYDCARDEIPERLQKYSYDDILYSARQCNKQNLILGYDEYDAGNYFIIEDLTFEGQAFLSNLNNPEVFKKTKEKSSVLGYALDKIIDFVVQFAASLLSR